MTDTAPVAPSVGIDHTLSLISATKTLLVDGIGIVKSGSVGVSSVLKGVKVVSDLYAVGKELTQVMPELKDIDALESARIGGAVYSACREIITSVQGLQALKKWAVDIGDVSWTHIISAIFGGGGASFVARYVVDRAVKTLDEITSKLESVAQKLVIVETKLEALQVFKDLVVEHDRKIVDLDTRARGRSAPRRGSD